MRVRQPYQWSSWASLTQTSIARRDTMGGQAGVSQKGGIRHEMYMDKRRESGESGEPAQYGTTGHVPQPKSVTYIDHDDPFVLVDQASGDPNLRSMTRNGWVCCGDDV